MKKYTDELVDKFVNYIGTKKFLMQLSGFIITYMLGNCLLSFFGKAFDPAPFLYLNLGLSLFGVFTYTFVAIHDKNVDEPHSLTLIKQNEKIIALLEAQVKDKE